MKNYYAILEVPEGSSAETIQQSYVRLTQQNQENNEALTQLRQAYEGLTVSAPQAEPILPTDKARRCPMGIDAQCPVLLGKVVAGDNFCPECGYLLAGMDTEASFETTAAPSEQSEIRLEEPSGRSHVLRLGTAIVGRENADILLADKTVSRQHARLEVTSDGEVMLEDLNSTNGTQVAGDRLLPYVPRQLFSGDRVRFGSFATELRLPEQTLHAASAEPEEEAPPVVETALAQIVEIRDGDGRRISLKEGITTFGRRSDNTVVLPGDPYVSGSHAQILALGDVFRLTDVGSTNGTLLNGERLAINAPIFLNPGDVILVGSTAFRFEPIAGLESTPDREADLEPEPASDAAAQESQTYAEG